MTAESARSQTPEECHVYSQHADFSILFFSGAAAMPRPGFRTVSCAAPLKNKAPLGGADYYRHGTALGFKTVSKSKLI